MSVTTSRVSACVFAVATSLAGCRGTGDVEYAGEVRVSSPELIELPSGVSVVADADEPLFHSDGFYWLYRDGYWMRSDSYRSGFVRVDMGYVPERVRRIERPQVYAQYRRHHGRSLEARATPQPPRSTVRQPLPPDRVAPDPEHERGVRSPISDEHDRKADKQAEEKRDKQKPDE